VDDVEDLLLHDDEGFGFVLCINIRLKGFPFFGVEDSEPDEEEDEDGIPNAEKNPSFIK
jgi:hypothetical protein